MDIREHVINLNQTRARVWSEAQAHLDDCQRRHPSRAMNGEEQEKWDRLNARVDEIDAEVRNFVDQETRESEAARARAADERAFGPLGVRGGNEGSPNQEADEFRAFLLGERGRTMQIDVRGAIRERQLIRQGASPAEARALLWDTGSVASAVPTLMARTFYEYAESSMCLWRMPTTKVSTDSGAPMLFPNINVHGIGTQVIAQGTAIGGTDPTFARMTLDSYKYGQLLQLASETIQDSGPDILDFVMSNLGRATGRVVGTDLVTGTGTSEPRGVMVALAAAGGGSVHTGGSLITPTYENLVDTCYQVSDEYRDRPSAAWLMRDATAGNIRKIRDGAGGTVGSPMWVPSLTNGIQGAEPDRLLGFPAYTDASVASLASNARIMAFGDFAAYYIRHVGAITIERSDDFAFNTDLVTLRAKWRVDGDLIDQAAIKSLVQNV